MHALAFTLSTLAAAATASGSMQPAASTSAAGPIAGSDEAVSPASETLTLVEPPPPATTAASAPAAETSAAPTAASPESAATTSAAPAPAKPAPRSPPFTGYGGAAVRLTGLNGEFAALVGIEAGVNLLQRVTIGGSLLWLLNPTPAGEFTRGAANRININYGGLAVHYTYARAKRVGGTIGGLIGGGGACVQNPENGRCADRTGFFVGEPRLGLQIQLAKIVRLHLAFGWRLLAARAWGGPPEPRLGGPTGGATLEFGWF